MLLKNTRRGTFWYCPDNCAHTENFFKGANKRVVAVNGRPTQTGAFGPRHTHMVGDAGTSKVEAQAIHNADAGDTP